MTIKVGDHLPEGKLAEFIETETAGCTLGPNTFSVADLTKGKTIAIFGLPGAFTPTCSAQHVPGYIQHAKALHAKGVDEIWCISVNDAFVMGAWGRELHATGVVRMMGDGNADSAKPWACRLIFLPMGWAHVRSVIRCWSKMASWRNCMWKRRASLRCLTLRRCWRNCKSALLP